MKEYSGQLGVFRYDPEYFEVQEDGFLHYIGRIRGGAVETAIPDGIKDCSYMFCDNRYLRIGPVLPKSCISAFHMFDGCKKLEVYPDINLALMEAADLSVSGMFNNCIRLEELSVHTMHDAAQTKKQLSVYVCACRRSADYAAHVRNMKRFIDAENYRRMDSYRLTHPLRYYMLVKKYGDTACSRLSVKKLSFSEKVAIDELVAFDFRKDLVELMHQRNLQVFGKAAELGHGSKTEKVARSDMQPEESIEQPEESIEQLKKNAEQLEDSARQPEGSVGQYEELKRINIF